MINLPISTMCPSLVDAYPILRKITRVEISPTGAEPLGACADITIQGFTTGKEVNFGSGYGSELAYSDIANATFIFTVVSEGYDSTGGLSTITRNVYGTSIVRQPYPSNSSNQEGTTTIRIALSEPIYDDDKNGGTGTSGTNPVVTIKAGAIRNTGASSELSYPTTNFRCINSSTLDYPKMIGRWDRIGGVHTGDLVTASFKMAARVYCKFGVACVRFDALGQSSAHTETSTVSTRTAVQRSGSSLYAECYQSASISLSSYTDNELVDLRFRTYPKVGDENSIIDTNNNTTAANECLGQNKATIVVDPDNDYALYGVVNLSTGNNTTGVTSGTLATAEATPYLNIGAAIEDGANRIYVLDGTHAFLGRNYNRVTPSTTTVVTYHPTLSSKANCIIRIDGTNQNYDCARLEYKDVTLRLASTTSYPYGEDVNIIRFNGCVFNDSTTGAGVVSLGYRSLVTYIDNCTGDLGEREWNLGLWSSDVVAFCMDGNDFGNPGDPRTTAIGAWEFCANKVKKTSAIFGASDISAAPTRNNFLLDFNEFLSYTGEGTILAHIDQENTNKERIAIVGNVFESLSVASTALLVLGDSGNNTVSDCILWHNTWVGERENLAYDGGSTGAPHRRDNWDVKYNSFHDMHVKGDVFYTSASATGGWSVIYKVGHLHNHDVDYTGNTSGTQDWLRLGLGATTGTATYTTDNSRVGANTGGGNYAPGTGSSLKARIPTGQRVITTDLYGHAVVENGDIGAIQVTT